MTTAEPTCTLYEDATGTVCGGAPAKRYLPGLRCAWHTPAVLAGRDEVVPDPAQTIYGRRIAAGLPDGPMTPAAPTVVDTRAVESGKRRASPAAIKAARAQVAAT